MAALPDISVPEVFAQARIKASIVQCSGRTAPGRRFTRWRSSAALGTLHEHMSSHLKLQRRATKTEACGRPKQTSRVRQGAYQHHGR